MSKLNELARISSENYCRVSDKYHKRIFKFGWDQCDSEAKKLLKAIAHSNCEIWHGSLDKKCGKCSVCKAKEFLK